MRVNLRVPKSHLINARTPESERPLAQAKDIHTVK